jgi:hypothetical protein
MVFSIVKPTLAMQGLDINIHFTILIIYECEYEYEYEYKYKLFTLHCYHRIYK